MGIALWVVKIALGAAFVVSGAMKLFTFDRYKKMAQSRSPQRGLGSRAAVLFLHDGRTTSILVPMRLSGS